VAFLAITSLNLIIDSGTKIELKNSSIINENQVNSNGTASNPVVFSSDNTGGVFVKNTTEKSLIQNTHFIGLSAPQQDNWSLTGAVTFYKSEVIFDSCIFKNNASEDALNIVSSKFKIMNIEIKECSSDALDIDFGKGEIDNIKVSSSKNDALDFSGSNIKIKNVELTNIGDKAISAGERTTLTGNNININKSFIAVASKDASIIKFKDVIAKNATYNFTVYQKKAQFDKSHIVIENSTIKLASSLIEEGCTLSLNGELIEGDKKDIYKNLYNPK